MGFCVFPRREKVSKNAFSLLRSEITDFVFKVFPPSCLDEIWCLKKNDLPPPPVCLNLRQPNHSMGASHSDPPFSKRFRCPRPRRRPLPACPSHFSRSARRSDSSQGLAEGVREVLFVLELTSNYHHPRREGMGCVGLSVGGRLFLIKAIDFSVRFH